MDYVWGVCRYLNEPKSIQNEAVLIEKYHCVWTHALKWRTFTSHQYDQEGSSFVPFPCSSCLQMMHIHFPSMWLGRECASFFWPFCCGCVWCHQSLGKFPNLGYLILSLWLYANFCSRSPCASFYESSEFTKRLVYYPWYQGFFQCSNAELCLSATKIDGFPQSGIL